MNSLTKALKKVANKVVDKGSDLIANRVMLKPTLDKWRGEDADAQRTQLTRNRVSRSNDKSMYGTFDKALSTKK